MKKLLILIIAILVLSLGTGCAAGTYIDASWRRDPDNGSIRTSETLVYQTEVVGKTAQGTLTIETRNIKMSATEDIQTEDIQSVSESSTIEGHNFTDISTISVPVALNYVVVTASMNFEDIATNEGYTNDYMEYKIIMDNNLKPLFTFKKVFLAYEDTALESRYVSLNENTIEPPQSYVISSEYNTSNGSYVARELLRTEFGDTLYTYSDYTANNLTTPYWDNEQLLFVIRSLSNFTDANFSYIFNNPSVIEKTVRTMYVTSLPGKSLSSDNIPFITEGEAIACTMLRIARTDTPLAGGALSIYYSDSYMLSSESNKVVRVPLLIDEGSMKYRLVSISVE